MASPPTLRRALFLIALCGLSGCSPDDAPVLCDIAPAPRLSQQPGILLVGQTARLEIFPLTQPSCGPEIGELPSSVTAELEGPGGEVLEGHIELGRPGFPSVLQFTPLHPGPHHILVAFSHVGGIHQFDIHAAQDRSAEIPRITLPKACSSLERTFQGTWVCGTELLRDGAPVASFPGSRLAVAGDVLWVVDSTRVQRYVDMGTELLLTGSVEHSRGTADFLLAFSHELVLLQGHLLARYTFQEGTVVSGDAELWTPGVPIASHGPTGVLLRQGEQLALASRTKIGDSAAVQVCPYQLLSGRFRRTQQECSRFPGEIVGFEPTILWTRDIPLLTSNGVSGGLLRRWEWREGRLVEQGSLNVGTQARVIDPPLLRPSAVPLLYSELSGAAAGSTTAVATWAPLEQEIRLEHLDAHMVESSASPALYWGRQLPLGTSTEIQVRIRQ